MKLFVELHFTIIKWWNSYEYSVVKCCVFVLLHSTMKPVRFPSSVLYVWGMWNFCWRFKASRFNLLTPTPAKTSHGGTTDLLQFMMSSFLWQKISLVTNSSRRKKSFTKCPNERVLVNWARFSNEKPIRFDLQNRRKIWSCYHLPLLVKRNVHKHFIFKGLILLGVVVSSLLRDVVL